MECRDPGIFIWVPSIIVLKSLEKEDKGICKEFNPMMFIESEDSGKSYKIIKNFREVLYSKVEDPYVAYNLLEKFVLFEDDDKIRKEMERYVSKESINEFDRKIKILSMQLQRHKPMDWNYFFDLAMNYLDE